MTALLPTSDTTTWSLLSSLPPTQHQTSATINDDWQVPNFDDRPLEQQEQNRDALLFVLDCSTEMRDTVTQLNSKIKNQIQQTHWLNCASLINQSLRKKIISSPDDLIGLLLFNLSKTSQNTINPNGFPGIHVAQPLEMPTASIIKRIETLLTSTESFNQQFPFGTENTQLDKVLWSISSLFAASPLASSKRCYKRALIFTCQDSVADHAERSRALTKANDLIDNDISLDIIPLRPANKAIFDFSAFYAAVVTMDEEDLRPLPSTAKTEGADKKFVDAFEELRSNLMRKIYKKRSLGTIDFTLGPDLTLAVKFYCAYHEQRKENSILLNKKTNERLKVQTNWLDAYGAYLDMRHQTEKYHEYGGERVVFSDAEIAQLKDFGKSGLLLMGFKPQSSLKCWYNIRSSYFLYPAEDAIKGSICLFAALLRAMSDTATCAVCRLIYRNHSAPRFVALLPQNELLDSRGSQSQPPGFNCIFLPYADDIRNLRFEPMPIAENSLINKARSLLLALSVKTEGQFDSTQVSNPLLQRHYAIIQAIALDEEMQETADQLMPDEEGMEKHRDVMEAFIHESFPNIEDMGVEIDSIDSEDYVCDGKRKKINKWVDVYKEDGFMVNDERLKNPKKSKIKKEFNEEEEKDGFSSIDWKKVVKTGQLKKLTVVQLKFYLTHYNLKVSGKKTELIERIEEHVQRALGGDDQNENDDQYQNQNGSQNSSKRGSRPQSRQRSNAKRRKRKDDHDEFKIDDEYEDDHT